MLIYRRTSLLESPAQTLVNTVNCVGVMGKGLAKAFKDRDAAMFARYKELCDQRLIEPGKLWLWRGSDSWTLNFPTKVHWRNPSKIEWIEAGLEKFVSVYEDQGIREISFPRLGCGNGGLEWNDVRPLMEHYLSKVKVPVYIHDFAKDVGLPEHLEEISQKVARRMSSCVDFDTFVDGIRYMTQIAGSSLIEIGSDRRFSAKMDEDSDLWIETESASWEYNLEDLHGVWVALLRGLVTRERIDWAGTGDGDCVLTLLSLLPNARPVEIQRGSSAEIAVELRPEARQIQVANSPKGQLSLGWH